MYGRIHVGNARPYVVFSLLKRFLEHEGLEATLVANVTDVNDKIYDAARAQGRDSAGLAREMTAAYTADTDGLGLGRPDVEPLATETIEEIIALIATLIDRGHAYAVDGDVYFRVRSHAAVRRALAPRRRPDGPGRGNRGGRPQGGPARLRAVEGEQAGRGHELGRPLGRRAPGLAHRVLGDGRGRCSGCDFDIHGGGSDLLFPHHENEAAQTLAARGEQLARIWMHNGMIELGRQDVEVARQHRRPRRRAGERGPRHADRVLRGGHYRSPAPWRTDVLADAAGRVKTFREAGRRLSRGDSPADLARPPRRLLRRPRGRLQHPARAGGRPRVGARGQPATAPATRTCARCSAVLGLENLLDAEAGPPPELEQLAERARGRRVQRATSRPPTVCATSCATRAGRSATVPTGRLTAPGA